MKLIDKAKKEAERLEKEYGNKTGGLGSDEYILNVVPTGILALDYALGTGGWPLGHPVEIFGAPDIGKTSVLGFNAIKNAQKMNLLCGIIALEPSFDKRWAYKNGVDPEAVVIARPASGEKAFQILYEWVEGDLVDLILFDSIGAVVSEAELQGGKDKVGGQSKLITNGVKKILNPVWQNNKSVIFLNQQRDDIGSKMPLKTSPGGNALHHGVDIRIHLKSTGSPFKEKIDEQDVVIGKTLVAVIERNKLSEGSKKRAEFDFYQMEHGDRQVGIDAPKDIVSTAIRTGIIQKAAGGIYTYKGFPGDENKIRGKESVYEFLLENNNLIENIRKEVIQVMLERGSK